MKCRSCSENNLSSILNLGEHAWCNDFLNMEDVGQENKYPLHLYYCNNCELLQLNHTIPKEVMFKEHTYVSSTTKTLKKHFLELAIENKKQFQLNSNDLIVDIGGNDGTQLLQYKNIGLDNVINVESANNIANISENNGIKTINSFFNNSLVTEKFDEKSVKLINASGVFFHLEELHSVIKGIKYCLEKNGILVIQFMYAGAMVKGLNFDGIYHEHLCYYTLESLKNLLEQYDLRIFDAYYSDIHSGSIMAKIGNNESDFIMTDRCEKIFEYDKKYTKEEFVLFGKKIESKRSDLANFIENLKRDDQNIKIYAYGAPAKGNTLLTYFGITKYMVQKCVEVNDLKINKYLPISHIPIIKESEDDVPDYFLLLAHNFIDEIIDRYKGSGIKFIIPFPEIKIIKA